MSSKPAGGGFLVLRERIAGMAVDCGVWYCMRVVDGFGACLFVTVMSGLYDGGN
jgi:hypothetical protein